MSKELEKLYRLANKFFNHNEQLSEFDLIDNELKELRKRKIKLILKNLYETESLGDYYKELKKEEKETTLNYKIALAKEHNNGFCFITINAKPDVPLAQFVQKVEKLAKRKLFTSTIWVYEQRGNTTDTLGKGFHAHMLCKRNVNYKPCKIASCVRNTCKTLVKDVKANHLLNIQFIGDDWAKDKEEYLLGKKTGEGKDIKQDCDKIWREKNNLKSYYNNAQLA